MRARPHLIALGGALLALAPAATPEPASAPTLRAAADEPVAPAPPGDTAPGGDPSEDAGFGDDSFSDLSLEDLMQVEVVTVTSGSRQAAPINAQAVPVGVVTEDDLHFGGFTNFYEALRFVPGVDVRPQGRNRPAVGVRGLVGRYSDRTLLLIDGRYAGEPFAGSVEPLPQPVFVEDLERVEVVKGPGGAVWGPNAFNGVINVISKAPRDTQGFLGSVQANDFGDVHAQLRLGVGAAHENDPERGTYVRLSAGYDELREAELFSDSPEAVTTATVPRAFFNDDLRKWSFDLEAERDLWDATRLSAGVAGSESSIGNTYLELLPGQSGEQTSLLRSFVALDHEFQDGSTARLQAYFNRTDTDNPRFFTWTADQHVLDGQYTFQPHEDHTATVGGNLLYLTTDASLTSQGNPALSRAEENTLDAGVFVVDRWAVTPGLTLEGQGRFDHFEADGATFAGRFAALKSLDPADRHVLRVGAGSAVRATTPGKRNVTLRFPDLPSPPFPPGTSSVVIDGGSPNEEENTWSLEAGYHGRLADPLTLRVDGYWQRYEGLSGLRLTEDPFGVGRILARTQNLGNAQGWGGEAELAWEHPRGVFAVWYAYHGFEADREGQGFRAYEPVRHTAGLRARHRVTDALTLSANLRFDGENASPGNLQPSIDRSDPSYRVDLTAAHELFDGRGEVLVGVTDLLDAADPALTNAGNQISPDGEGRGFFVRLQARF